jgi:putative ABC transport system permease protein
VSYLIRISLRRIVREKGYALVNIIGLSLGMGSALIIFLFLRFETSYDSWHPDNTSIYQVGTELNIMGQSQGYAVSSAALAPALVENSPQIVSALRIFHLNYFLYDIIFYHEGKAFFEQEIFGVDSTLFDFFSNTFIHGDARTALEQPFSMVVTRSMAESIFGHTDVKDYKVRLSDIATFTITAVVEDPPLNTQFQYRVLISMSSLSRMPVLFEYAFGSGFSWSTLEQTYGSTVVWSYIKVRDDFSPKQFL